MIIILNGCPNKTVNKNMYDHKWRSKKHACFKKKKCRDEQSSEPPPLLLKIILDKEEKF